MRQIKNQRITVWLNTGENEYGEESFGTPQVLYGRWEDRADEVRAPTGETIISKSIVWLPIDAGIGSMLALGDFAEINDPSLAGAQEVQATFAIPSVRTNAMEYRAIL